MKEIVFGTKNRAKILVVEKTIKNLPLKIISIEDIVNVKETGSTPLENAVIKSKGYYDIIKKPVFSIDSGLYINNFSDDIQPGVYVRRVNGIELNDEEMIEYYSSKIREHGDSHAHYKTAIALATENKIYTHEWKDYTFFTNKPSKVRIPGHPLTSLEICLRLNKYYAELTEEERKNNKEALNYELYNFFKNLITKGKI